MKMYKTKYGDSIEEVLVVKQTDKQIVFLQDGKERREAKVSEYYSFHNTKEEAISYLISKQEDKIRYNERQIEYHKEKIAKIKLL